MTISQAFAVAQEHHQAGRLQAAEQICRQILAVDSRHADATHLLGVIAGQGGNHSLAAEYLAQAVALVPDRGDFHVNLGDAYRALREFPAAIACYRRAVQLNPRFANAHFNLGSALQDIGQCPEAITCYRRGLELQPDRAAMHNDLGIALEDRGQLPEAIACYRRAIDLEPNFTAAHNNLGCALLAQGQHTQASACFQRVLQADPAFAPARDNALQLLHYRSGVTLRELADAHQEYERQHAAPLRRLWQPHDNVRDPRRRLRLGFVSPDFRRHPVGYFLTRVLENIDRDQCEIVCYSDHAGGGDERTAQLRATATPWRDVAGRSDQDLAEQIRTDRIDILFDLAGHTDHNRLLVFARKPAPIQITWMGYVGTTGLKAMDYLLADRYEVPEGAEPYYQERVLRMPEGYVCYDPPDYAPAVSPLPALERGSVTFGCFNNPAKITPQVVEVWAQILRRLPGVRLVLKFRGLDDPPVRQRLTETFTANGVDSTRLEFHGASPQAEFLAQYNRIDLALDPFPYNGGLTTCEALWMGVPVITCPGETFASRHSLSHLSNVGLMDAIAGNLDDYVERAVSLAGDLPRLAAMRAGLREQMAASPLCDGQRFAANLMLLLRDVWRQWVQALP